MVSESQAYFIKEIDIPCERDNINFYAREVGFFDGLWPTEQNIERQQLYIYFLENAERGLENANKRLTEYRAELTRFNQQQRELQPV